MWDAATGKGGPPLLQHLNGYFAISKDGKRLATVALPEPGKAVFHLMELPGGKEIPLPDLPSDYWAYSFSPDGKLLVGARPSYIGAILLVCDLEKKGKVRV